MTQDPELMGARGRTCSVWGEQERRALLAWVGENLPKVRRSVSGQHFLYWSLGIGFVVGLAADVGGYLLRSSVTTEPLGLVADLLYGLGYAPWFKRLEQCPASSVTS